MRLDDRISEHFTLGEFVYRRGDRVYLPDQIALVQLRRTCELVLEPLRLEAGAPIYVLSGGGFDPLRDLATGKWVSHRSSPTTQHYHGGAVDFRVGTNHAGGRWAPGWSMQRAARRAAQLLVANGILGGVGKYPLRWVEDRRNPDQMKPANNFVHVDPRARRARWWG